MWVTPITEKPEAVAAFVPGQLPALLPANDAPAHTMPQEPERQPSFTVSRRASPERKTHLSRSFLYLAGSYLLGTFSAGLMQGLCSAEETDRLATYLQSWQELFSIRDATQAAALFGAELLTVLGALGVLLLLGLSALGPVPIHLFLMLYGAGMGLLTSQLLVLLEPWKFALVALLSGLPACLMTGLLCWFGASALRVSQRLYAFSFGGVRRGEQERALSPGAKRLVGEFLLTGVAVLPLCGASVCLSCLALRFLG